MRRVYKTLLRLYPRDYTELFAAEMSAAFEEAFEERRRQGAAIFLRFAVAELTGLVAGAMAELIAKSVYALYHSNSSYISGRCLPDPLRIRPAGLSRESYFATQAASAKTADLIDETGSCLNAHQTFVLASPLRRLLILICKVFLPIHPRMGAKTRV
jgi:hypothetical protein